MAAAYVQEAHNTGSSVTITGVAAGSLLVWCGDAGGAVTALSDDRGDTWTEALEDDAGGSHVGHIWYCMNASSGTHVVTRTGGFGSFEAYFILEFTGAELSAALDKTAVAHNAAVVDSTPDSGNTATTAQADEILVGFIGTQNSINYSSNWQNGFTSVGFQVGTSRGLTPAYKIVSATGAYAAQASANGTDGEWIAAIATFKAAAGGGTSTTDGKIIFRAA